MAEKCEAVAAVVYPTYADRAIIKLAPVTTTTAKFHSENGVHQCTGQHRDLGGIKIHRCICGVTFYYLSEAVAILVQQYEDFLSQLEAIEL